MMVVFFLLNPSTGKDLLEVYPHYASEMTYFDSKMVEHCSVVDNRGLMLMRHKFPFIESVNIDVMPAEEKAEFLKAKKR